MNKNKSCTKGYLPPSWPKKNWQRLGTTPKIKWQLVEPLGLTLGVTPTMLFLEQELLENAVNIWSDARAKDGL